MNTFNLSGAKAIVKNLMIEKIDEGYDVEFDLMFKGKFYQLNPVIDMNGFIFLTDEDMEQTLELQHSCTSDYLFGMIQAHLERICVESINKEFN